MARPAGKKKDLGELGLHQLGGQLLTDDDIESERWYHAQPKWPATSADGLVGTKAQWMNIASEALSSASRMYDKRVGGSSNTSLSGRGPLARDQTFGDMLAASTLSVQQSPLHRLDELRELLEMSKRKSRNEREQALDALKDLFINDLLPDNRLLLAFHDRDFRCDRKALTKRHLVYALFENELKTIYREFVQILEDCGRDTVTYIKYKSVTLIFDLLVAKPENEKVLLYMLVSKIGDPERRVSSTASYNLTKLIRKHHPQMRVVVVREIEQTLRQAGIKPRAQFNAVNFLNQIAFTDGDTQLARDIVRIYLDLFTKCIADGVAAEGKTPLKTVRIKKRYREKKQKKGNDDPEDLVSDETKNSRLTCALLLGVNRAFPFTKPEEDDNTYDKYFQPLFRLSHSPSFGSATQSLALLLQVSQSNSVQNDRLYRALYSRIQDAAEVSDTIQASFLNIVFKAMKEDTNPKRVKAFAKRLLQAGSYGSSGFAGACMVVVSECFRSAQTGIIKSFLSIPERDDEEETFFDADVRDQDVGIMELSDSESDDDGEDDDTEDKIEGGGRDKHAKINEVPKRKKQLLPSIESSQRDRHSLDAGSRDVTQYDPQKRDPIYSGADKSSLWEVVAMSAHYHPSVSMFSKTLCERMNAVENKCDPLKDYSLIAFLDRICYKKAKNRAAKSLYGKRSSRYRDDPVANSVQFQNLVKAGNVQEDDKFLAKFFDANPHRVKRPKNDKGGDDSASDVDSDEEGFEDAMRMEMERLGADRDLFSAADIDNEDEDEVKAFEKAFAEDLVESDDGGGNNDRDAVSKDDDGLLDDVNLNDLLNADGVENELGDLVDDDEDDEDDSDGELPGKRSSEKRKRGQGTISMSSVFAAAEDYEEAIDKEMEEAAREDDDSPSEVPLKGKGRTAKRKIHTQRGGKPGKKRQRRKRK